MQEACNFSCSTFDSLARESLTPEERATEEELDFLAERIAILNLINDDIPLSYFLSVAIGWLREGIKPKEILVSLLTDATSPVGSFEKLQENFINKMTKGRIEEGKTPMKLSTTKEFLS